MRHLASVVSVFLFTASVWAGTSKDTDVQPVVKFVTPVGPFKSSTDPKARIAFQVSNPGSKSVVLHVDRLDNAIFGLVVLNDRGERVPPIPPPPPPPGYAPRTLTLAPGKTVKFEQDLNVFSPPLPPGEYKARINPDSGVSSPDVWFRIGPR